MFLPNKLIDVMQLSNYGRSLHLASCFLYRLLLKQGMGNRGKESGNGE